MAGKKLTGKLRERHEQIIEAIKAHMDGLPIERSTDGGKSWRKYNSVPDFDPAYDWRPEPPKQYRPFTFEELTKMLGETLISADGLCHVLVWKVDSDSDGDFFVNDAFTAEDLFRGWTYDGDPAGMLDGAPKLPLPEKVNPNEDDEDDEDDDDI